MINYKIVHKISLVILNMMVIKEVWLLWYIMIYKFLNSKVAPRNKTISGKGTKK